jgi:hypothetical protein
MKNLKAIVVIGLATMPSLFQATLIAGQRPISDFVSRQGQWSVQLDANGNADCAASAYDGGLTGFVLEPPIQNFVDWIEPQNDTSTSFDYAGLVDKATGGALGTTMSGSIDEVVHQDGTVTVTILLHTTHALAWATTGFDSLGTKLFGNTGAEVVGGAAPSFGDCKLKLVINGPAANQPLPDFDQMFWGCGPWSFVSVYFIGSATGTLPDGTPARLQTTQTGVIFASSKANPNSRVGFDQFPAEHIVITPLR